MSKCKYTQNQYKIHNQKHNHTRIKTHIKTTMKPERKKKATTTWSKTDNITMEASTSPGYKKNQNKTIKLEKNNHNMLKLVENQEWY